MTTEEVHDKLEEVISEVPYVKKNLIHDFLEALITNIEIRSCDGCIHKPNAGKNYPYTCGSCIRFYADNYNVVPEEE